MKSMLTISSSDIFSLPFLDKPVPFLHGVETLPSSSWVFSCSARLPCGAASTTALTFLASSISAMLAMSFLLASLTSSEDALMWTF